ncbi:MAG: N-acetylmuramoyl-L-alanine amidase [Deltaproteobacteria bacterium]|nr:N-acetylmuramoyl-L-alanine amidase [Deltaproteobacteria bacterium]
MRVWLAAVILAGCSSSPASEPGSPAKPGPTTALSAPADATDDATLADAGAPDAPSVSIVDAPMKWSAERERLTLDYRRQHSDANASDLTIEPTVIVLHYTGGGSAKGTRSYFDNPTIEAERKALARAGKVNVSSHFVVDRDGTIYQLQPMTRFARHCIGLNHVAVGIENVGDEAKFPLTDAQVIANEALVRWIATRHRITHLLGHHEVMSFRGNPLYVERDASYTNSKPDPGKAFMAKVRARVEDLALAGS